MCDQLDRVDRAYMIWGGDNTVRCSLVNKECMITRNCLKCNLPEVEAFKQLAEAMQERSRLMMKEANI